ncbi:MAG: hypothetical protein J6A21_03365 [Lentisphaeria bacterium]|nr:hypothetical protein [Lentisphaeria bacterium]
MKLGITGSRNLTEFDFMEYFEFRNGAFKAFADSVGKGGLEEIITGGAKGIDSLAMAAAGKLFLPRRTIEPNFQRYHGRLLRAAFLSRDEKIVRSSDALLAVWNGETSSHGTLYTMNAALEDGKKVFLVIVEEKKILREGVQTQIIEYPGRKRLNLP